MAPKVLYVGLGNIGRGMAKNIAEKAQLDSPLLLFNRTTQRATDLSAKIAQNKSEVAKSLDSAVAQVDVIFLCLANDKAVTETVDALAKLDLTGKVVAECSTIHPDTTTAVAETLTAKGADFVACPVFGAPAMADSGNLVSVPAGPKSSVDRIRPYLEGVSSRAVIDMSGEPYHKALQLKLVGNTFVLNMVEQIAEGHVLAEKVGLGTQHVHKFLELLLPGIFPAYSMRMLTGDYWKREEPLFHVDLARKDAGHALRLAKDNGCEMQNVMTGDKHLAAVQKKNPKFGDIVGIYGVVREEAGLPFENDV
ncbi:NAD binding domain of 6-phosphogluconate dehydrogenase-domain-containing protein [Coniella lustricola]|uniref:NAD binding domain of 6-phosphogluconate dehydrogenase-domain-containing protein n=1 Tax=Coniella lustricola TaxID=2025994 RepID=A0A2T3ANQ5_9PEZI|nr:NAD binding domain of 6-phosphogluconate dehydrogenase-domain-containing protein [Coniella lustricola]